MKIIATSDIHYNQLNKNELKGLVRDINARRPDVFIFGGDVALRRDFEFLDGLKILSKVKAPHKLFVPGNHDLFSPIRTDSVHGYTKKLTQHAKNDDSSLQFYKNELGDLVRKYGFHLLDNEYRMINGVAFVGNIGWYDYSMKAASIDEGVRFMFDNDGRQYKWRELTDEQISKKGIYVIDSANSNKSKEETIVEMLSNKELLSMLAIAGAKLSDAEEIIKKRVMQYSDGHNVYLGMSDAEFLDTRLNKIQSQLDLLEHRADHVVFTSHMLPYKEHVFQTPHDPDMSYRAIFNGSLKLGELLNRYDNVRTVLHGHNINTYPIYGVGDKTVHNIHYRGKRKGTTIRLD